MALALKPHEAEIYTVSDSLGGGGEILGDSRTADGTVRGHLCNLSPVQALEQFGFDTQSGGKWMQDVDAVALKPGDHLIIGGQRYAIRTNRVVYDAILAIAHESYLVERVK